MRSPAKRAIKTEQTSCSPYSLMSLAQGKCCSNNHRGPVACSLTLNVKRLERHGGFLSARGLEENNVYSQYFLGHKDFYLRFTRLLVRMIHNRSPVFLRD